MDREKKIRRHHSAQRREKDGNGGKRLGRRAALTRLGLMAGAAYVAPSLALLKRGHAHHKPGHDGGPGGGGGNPPWSQPSKPSKPSKPSRPSR